MSDDPNIVVENELLRRGFTSIPNYIFGLPISSNAKLIYMALLSYAWTNRSCYPGLAKLCTDVSLSDKPVTKAIEELSNASLLEVKRRGQGKTNLYILKDFNFTSHAPNGSESRIGESPNQESENLRIKNRRISGSSNGGSPALKSENLRIKNRRISESRIGESPALKSEKRRIRSKRVEKDTGEERQEETHPHNRARAGRTNGVGVGSKFTLEECRQYATHLQKTGEGITNPGGYATAIHRSGEADALIEKFFQPQTSAEPLDASKCPDCQGTGFWYPQGREQGVSKCKHARLASKLHPDQSQPSNDKLAPEEITERATLIADLLGSGYTLERARMQFGAGLQPDDWEAIEALATTRLGRNAEG